jgi:hypothetical protein
MVTNSRDDLPPDPVRDALNAIHGGGFHSWRKILKAAGLETGDYTVSEDALRKYGIGVTIHTRKETWKRLTAFIESPAGKRMRGLAALGNHSSSERLIDTLSSGAESKPSNTEVAGLYFAYHGSYLVEKHYAVRVLEITERGNVLSVTDLIRENISGQSDPHTAHGCAVFFDQPPRLHIVTDAEDNDNRHGLGLFIGTSPVFSGNVLTEVVGTISGMTKGGHPFSRSCIIVRHASAIQDGERYKQIRSEMIGQTGVFQLATPKPQHRGPINTLRARLMVSENRERYADPFLSRFKRVKP